MTLSYGSLSIAQLSTLIQGGSVDPVTVAEQVLDAIESHDDKAVFISLTRERAMAEAHASSKRLKDGRSLGLLEGIPVAWKDLFDVAGSVTAAGSRLLLRDQAPAALDAAVVSALASAGMVATGRVNMSEFAFSGLGINPHFGTPKNPRSTDVARIPGGSSSGSGVAVASALVPVSIGSDTGGSVRIPAALNGIVGYKATRGRYPMTGVFPLSGSLDSLGPLCRSVQDAIWIDAAMRGAMAPTASRRPLAGLEVVIPTNVVFDDAEPGVVAAFEAAVERLSAAGVMFTRLEIPAFAEILQLMASHGALVTAEAYWLHKARITGPDAGLIDPRVVSRTRFGEEITLPHYLDILSARKRLIEAVDRLVGDRLIAFPTVAHVAPLLEPLKTDDQLFVATNGKTLRNTLLGNFLDWCGVSIPCEAGDAGMPVGFLLSGLARGDERLLSVALVAEPVIRGETI
ncbi:amidase [Rhizobium leguminosarum]|uniref:amidase n=1 Tax=Rhizobium TaxID=379 RepID=UPI0013BD0918|nr:amidase [Rhizobium leguminosarum]MBY5391062.1 amidase [Rhizobium leguminosarum]MBY5433202.1 amidase [Rhizobium leguminosarum]NEK44196.1 amidase [Rhizobium leguminosarum]